MFHVFCLHLKCGGCQYVEVVILPLYVYAVLISICLINSSNGKPLRELPKLGQLQKSRPV